MPANTYVYFPAADDGKDREEAVSPGVQVLSGSRLVVEVEPTGAAPAPAVLGPGTEERLQLLRHGCSRPRGYVAVLEFVARAAPAAAGLATGN